MKKPANWSSVKVGFAQGVLYAILWGAGMWLLSWRHQESMTLQIAVIVSIAAGAVFGLGMGYFHSRRKRKSNPPQDEA